MKTLLLTLSFFASTPAFALDVFNLNVFDQLQGSWAPDFREKRLKLVADYITTRNPSIVVFEEARGGPGGDSVDAVPLGSAYPFRKYVHEMTGADGASYGYWIGAKRKPRLWIEDGFAFPGGVARKFVGAVWDKAIGKKCLGVIGLHLSYQTTDVRQKEAAFVLDWVKKHESDCKSWLVLGDFNASEKDKEMQLLFDGGLKYLYKELKPTVGAFNPIRRIYGENIPSLTIDWALGWNLAGNAEVVLDSPYRGEWLSDHAGIFVRLP